jgi:CHAT domain-containing protein
MKLAQLSGRILLVVAWVLLGIPAASAQSGNMSDKTLPDPESITTQPETNTGEGANTPATAEENTVDNLGENTAGEEATVTEENATVDTPDANDTAIVNPNNSGPETELIEVEQVEVPQETATATNELPAESDQIVEKLLEEDSLREIKNTEEEVAQEETPEKVAQEDTEDPKKEVAQEDEEETPEKENSEVEVGQLDRVAYETQFQEAPNDLAILMQEEFQLTELVDSSGLEIYGSVPSVKDISHRLAQLAQQTGKKPAFINISLQENQLESFVVLPEQVQANAQNSLVASSELNGVESPRKETIALRKTVTNTSREDIIATATEFRQEVSDIRKLNQNGYKQSSQRLYNVLIKPIEAELEANNIDVLIFSMDSGLRLLPVAALYDGEQFLVEKYAMGIVPSFGLTDTRYVSPERASILAMGASEFKDQVNLPTMPIELKTIVSNPRRGESFLNEQFTIPNFIAQNSGQSPFSIIHLGTHAEFKVGDLSDSYIQFYDDRLRIPQLQKVSEDLGWNSDDSPIELLVLSACETALGDKEAELGFAGLAVQAGVKSALASLWYVSDLGTLALMGEFYDQLDTTLNKAEALRQTQLQMLNSSVKVDSKQVKLSNGTALALPADFPEGTLTLDHPYFWSSFTLIGNWN